MYSRSTERRMGRMQLPPGYDGSAFRHDTGEKRPYRMHTEMKIHGSGAGMDSEDVAEVRKDGITLLPKIDVPTTGERTEADVQSRGTGTRHGLEGMLGSLREEDWLLLGLVLLLLYDGSEAWDLILLLMVLLAVP